MKARYDRDKMKSPSYYYQRTRSDQLHIPPPRGASCNRLMFSLSSLTWQNLRAVILIFLEYSPGTRTNHHKT